MSRRDGRPASGALVLCSVRGKHWQFAAKRADVEGHALFEKLPAGEYALSVMEPGFVRAEAQARLGEGEVATVLLSEPEGRTSTVRVVDAEGEAVRFAHVTVWSEEGPRYVSLRDDVQTMGLWTDADGRCVLADLCPGRTSVHAAYGSRDECVSFQAGEDAEIRLPAARRDFER